MAFCFPAIHAQIDWARGHESLEKELLQIAPHAAEGRRFVDKLVKVVKGFVILAAVVIDRMSSREHR